MKISFYVEQVLARHSAFSNIRRQLNKKVLFSTLASQLLKLSSM
jgi:hypothetical protein